MRGTILRLVAFTLLCFAFTSWLAFTIGNINSIAIGPVQLYGKHSYSISALFEDSTGLLPTDNVKVAGVVVGKVTTVKLDHGRALIGMKVRKSLRLPSDSTASIRWRNLLGQRYVYLYPGQSATTLRGGDRIPQSRTRSVVDLGELFNRLGPIVKAIEPDKVNAFLRSFTSALEGNEASLGQSLHDLSLVAETLGQHDAAVGRLVSNLDAVTGAITDRDREIRTVLDNLAVIATTFNAHSDVLVAASSDLNGFTNRLADLITTNRANIDLTIGNLDSIVKVVGNRLHELESALTNLDDSGLRLYNASRFGEWLNQVIPCGAVTPTPGVNQGLEATCSNGTAPISSPALLRGGPLKDRAANGRVAIGNLLSRAFGGTR